MPARPVLPAQAAPARPQRSERPEAQFELPLGDNETRKADTPERRRVVILSGQAIEYTLRRARRRSIGFVIGDQGLTVSAPKWATLAQIDEALHSKQKWIFAKTVEAHERRKRLPVISWEHGCNVPYLGTPITIHIATGTPARRRVAEPVFDEQTRILSVSLPPDASAIQLKERVQGWLQGEARKLFSTRLDHYAARLGVQYRLLRLSSAATRWGSCCADGKILLNWRLIHFPMSSIDYVVAHELSHLKEMNHSPRFWQTVAQLFPDYEAARAHLKNPPPELLPKF